MKKTTHLKSWLSIIMMLFMVGNAWGQANIHTSNVTLDKGTNAQVQTIKLEADGTEYASMKLGTTNNKGIATFKIEAGTSKIHLHVAGWKGDGEHNLIVKTNVGIFQENRTRTINIPLTNDEGISGDGLVMTLAHPELASTDYYKEILLEGVTEMATITLETSAKRAVVWGINIPTYKITYDGNGYTSGDVPVDNTEYKEGDETFAPESGTMSKYGYEFASLWNTKPDGTGTAYGAGERITVNSDLKLYAQWTAKTCPVTWYVNGSPYTKGSPKKTVTFGSKVTSLPTAPTDPFDSDLTFMGWTDKPIDGTSTSEPTILFNTTAKAPTVNDENVKYYAVFANVNEGATTLTKIENVADIENGIYAIITKNFKYYLPNIPNDPEATKATKAEKITYVDEEETSVNSVNITEDMKWKLTISNGIIQLESKSNPNNYLWAGAVTNSTRVQSTAPTSTTNEWKAIKHTTHGVLIYANTTENQSDIDRTGLRYLAFYNSSTRPDWRNYKEGSSLTNPGNLYKITEGTTYSNYTTHHIQVNVGSTGYSTLYYSDRNLVVPEHVTAKTYKLNGQNFEESKLYNANSVIPTDEAVVLFSQEAFDKQATTPIFFGETTATASNDSNNELKGTDEATDLSTLYTPNEVAANYFYALTRDKEKKNVGFYWMNNAGTTFTNGAHKAYLMLPKSRAAGIKGFSLEGDFETAIVETLDAINDEVNESDAIYNLSGQRVSKVSKGVFIKNGKKYISK